MSSATDATLHETPAPVEPKPRIARSIPLALILIVGIGLRLHAIAADSLWYDELCSVEISAGHGMVHYLLPTRQLLPAAPDLLSLDNAQPAWRIWTSLDLDFHPPLYYLALRCWRHLAGSSDLALRLLSMLAGIAALILIYDLTRLAHGAVAGLWAAALFAVANTQIDFAQEARMYMPLVALSLASANALMRIERLGQNRWRVSALFGSSLAMMLTHYIGILVAVALGCYALIRFLQRRPGFGQAVAALVLSAWCFAVIWGPFLWQQRQSLRPETQTMLVAGDWRPGEGLLDLVDLPIELIAQPITRQAALGRASLIVLFLPLLVLRRHPAMLLWLLWLAATLGVLALFSEIRHAHPLRYDRYALIAGPPVYIILASLLSDRGAVLRHLLPAAAVLTALLALPATYRPRPFAGLDHLVHTIDRLTGDNDIVVFCSDGKRDWISGHPLAYRRYSDSPERPIVILHNRADTTLLAALSRFEGVVAVTQSERPLDLFLPGYEVKAHRNEWPHAGVTRLVRRSASTQLSSLP